MSAEDHPRPIVTITSSAQLGPYLSPPIPEYQGREVGIHLDPFLFIDAAQAKRERHYEWKRTVLYVLALQVARHARAVHITGGNPALREAMAALIRAAFGSERVTWDEVPASRSVRVAKAPSQRELTSRPRRKARKPRPPRRPRRGSSQSGRSGQ